MINRRTIGRLAAALVMSGALSMYAVALAASPCGSVRASKLADHLRRHRHGLRLLGMVRLRRRDNVQLRARNVGHQR